MTSGSLGRALRILPPFAERWMPTTLSASATLVFALAILVPWDVSASQPLADCRGFVSVFDVGRSSFVRGTATLERLGIGGFVPEDSVTDGRTSSSNVVMLRSPWTHPLASGTYRVRLDAEVFDGLLSATPGSAQLAAWPRNRVLGSSMTTAPFECGTAGPTINVSPPPAAIRGTPYVAGLLSEVAASGRSFSVVAGPTGLAVDSVSGTVSWLPDENSGAEVFVVLRIEDPTAGWFWIEGIVLQVRDPS